MAENSTQKQSTREFSWPFWPVVPLYPYGKRRTICREVVQDTLWCCEQIQGILYVVTPIRMSVVKLQAGGLLIYAPVAPTSECLKFVRELVALHGEVKYIVLPTISGIEHKVFVGPFARKFPTAQVFVAPSQWSFPLNLPLSWLGLPPRRTQLLPAESSKAPFGDEFDYALLGPIELGPGRFAEVAFFHRRSRTLLVTDTVISIPEEPPAIVQLDPFPLLFHARDRATDGMIDTLENRRQGWQRIALFTCYFQPSVLEVRQWGQAFQDALKAPNRSKQSYFGLFPFQWKDNWLQSFQALRGDGRLFVAPILQTLILNRAPAAVLKWADQVATWGFERIISCHFDAPITASPHQFRQAFAFLEHEPDVGNNGLRNQSQCFPDQDFQLLREIDQKLSQSGIVPPAKLAP